MMANNLLDIIAQIIEQFYKYIISAVMILSTVFFAMRPQLPDKEMWIFVMAFFCGWAVNEVWNFNKRNTVVTKE